MQIYAVIMGLLAATLVHLVVYQKMIEGVKRAGRREKIISTTIATLAGLLVSILIEHLINVAY
jgi:hypothetical protein